MEVHAHSHTSPDNHRGSSKKKWTHYLWEFLMLFLAVFCGFLAEYQLEHKIEKDRGKQYIASFYDDLQINLSSLTWLHATNEKKLKSFENIFPCYDSSMNDLKGSSCLGAMLQHAMYFINISFADGTLGQLKNAGGFRLLTKNDRDSIIVYDNMIRGYRDWESTAMQQAQDNVRNSFDLLGHFQANKFLYTDSIAINNIPVLFVTDKNAVNKMFNVLIRYRNMIKRQNKWFFDIAARTSRLLGYLRSRYHFK
jgi:hypothetical protein